MNKTAIKKRLRSFLKETGGFYRLYARGAFPEGTVKTWVGGHGSLPGLEQAAKLTQETGLSLDWLVTGEGSEFRGGPAPRADVAQELRSHVAAVMTPEFGPLGETALPRSDVMLVEVMTTYRERIKAVLRDRRRRGLQEAIGKARADTSAAGQTLATAMEAAIGRAVAAGTDAFSGELDVLVSTETLVKKFGDAKVSEVWGGGGATPEWDLPIIQLRLVPGEPDSQ